MTSLKPPTVCQELVRLHEEFQERLGENNGGVTPQCRPLEDLPGFDSPLVPIVIRTLARRLEIKLPPKAKITNLYVSDQGRRRLSLREIADGFCEAYGKYADD